jgi:hypothetical protein
MTGLTRGRFILSILQILAILSAAVFSVAFWE